MDRRDTVAVRERPFSAKERQARILQLLQQQGSVRVADLRHLFRVSDVTVREDLDALERQKLLIREYGGAIANQSITSNLIIGFAQRALEHAEEKARIGRAAAALVRDNETVIFDAGTTVMEVVRALPHTIPLTAMTRGLNIAIELGRLPQCITILTGGVLVPEALALVGSEVVEALRNIYADRLFLAAASADVERGLSELTLAEAPCKRAMIESASEIILVADSSKFDRVAFARVGPLNVAHKVVTDVGIAPATADAIRRMGVELILV
jgi:DeoR family transcriptional regulator of aga operon